MSKFKKPAVILAAVSAFLIVLGIVLYSVLGFNTMPDKNKSYTFEVHYDVMFEITEGAEEDLETYIEGVLKDNKLSYLEREANSVIDSSSFSETTDKMLVYTFAEGTDEAALAKAVNTANTYFENAGDDTVYGKSVISASWHYQENERFYEAAWRGAIGIGLGIVAALIYVCCRYGVASAVAGLACAADSALLTAAVFAVTRFPVYGATPLLYAAIAAFMSVLLWIVLGNRIRDALKAPENETAVKADVVRATAKASLKTVLLTAGCFVATTAVAGLIAAPGAMLYVLPAVIAELLPVCAVLWIGPEVQALIRASIDKKKADKKIKYFGKKKADAAEE